jgi:hypothetical protein
MATCLHCPTELPGRTKVCDSCKARVAARAVPARAKPARRGKPSTAAPAEPPPVSEPPPALWRGIGQHLDTPAGQLALEACRVADRLDEFESAIAGKGVLHLMQFRLKFDLAGMLDGDDVDRVAVTVEISKVLSEARQQAVAFAGILDKLAELKAKTAKSAEPPVGKPAAANPLDELGQKRQQRGQKA